MKKKNSDAEKLAQIIKDNPGATAIIDNDSWYLDAPQPEEYPTWDKEQKHHWDKNKSTLARSYDFPELEVSYGYGLLQAMAVLNDITIENI